MLCQLALLPDGNKRMVIACLSSALAAPIGYRNIIGTTLAKHCQATGSANCEAQFARAVDYCLLQLYRYHFSEEEPGEVAYNLELAGTIVGGEMIRTKLRYRFYQR
ncbi:hypothetical protein B0I18_102525 [Taibaiella chishuiensis]|uniref:Uncharacterized protein n=1 Tax=Taibaiella chishuiensis TaxID=1434707 RepID=A0A2P8D8J9_9BACT|nr:hypothetical protein B0I18_102525 [Taibaiella chishuiensis]